MKYFDETTYGKGHSRTLNSYNNKVGLLIKLGKYNEVILLLLPALEIPALEIPALETLKSMLEIVGMKHSIVVSLVSQFTPK